MKKILAISLVPLGVIFLSGCSQQKVNQAQPITPDPVVQKPVGEQSSTTQPAIASAKQASSSISRETGTTTLAKEIPVLQEKYNSEKYKFSLSYSKSYLKNKGYAIYDANFAVFNGYAWGINKGQENLFVIDVYPKKNENEVLKYNQLTVTKEEVELNSSITANNLKSNELKYGYLVSKGNYIYIIHSSYINSPKGAGFQEFQQILLSLRISE